MWSGAVRWLLPAIRARVPPARQAEAAGAAIRVGPDLSGIVLPQVPFAHESWPLMTASKALSAGAAPRDLTLDTLRTTASHTIGTHVLTDDSGTVVAQQATTVGGE